MIIVAIIVMIMMMVVIACTLIEDAQMGVGRSWRKSEFAVPVILCFHSDAIGLFYKTCFWKCLGVALKEFKRIFAFDKF